MITQRGIPVYPHADEGVCYYGPCARCGKVHGGWQSCWQGALSRMWWAIRRALWR